MPNNLDEPDNLSSAPTQAGGETVQIGPDERLWVGDTVQIAGGGPGSEFDHNTTVFDQKADDFSTEIVVETGLDSDQPGSSGSEREIIGHKIIAETSQTSFDSASASILSSSSVETERDKDTTLRPNKLRTALIYLLFAFAAVWLALNVYQSNRIQTEITEWKTAHRDGRLLIDVVDERIADKLTVGDELTAVNEVAVARNGRLTQLLERLQPNQTYRLQMRPTDGGAIREVELVAPPGSLILELNRYFINLVIPATFFLCGLIVFFFQPNNKLVLLMALPFALLTISMPVKPLVMPGLSTPWNAVWSVGVVVGLIFAPMLFHLHAIFPEPSGFIRRFPIIEKLLYIPCLVLTVPIAAMWHLSLNGFSQFDFSIDQPLYTQLLFLPHTGYLLGALVMLILNYFLTDATGKRRIRFLAAGTSLACGPYLFDKLIRPLEHAFDFRIYPDDGTRFFMMLAPTMLLPITFAYAITRHKVIPVSFVLRRGLQYLLAKNALRVLLLIPVLGILWNLALNPGRQLDEIVLRNSPSFYVWLIFAAVLVAINRFGLREWIDRKFFRRQYNQEALLRDLGESIQEADSVSDLSRLVSGKIQAALHPSSIYLFFKSDDSGTDFSLSYTSTGAGSDDFKIDADSPVLRFLETERRALDFAVADTGHLPTEDERWLRSLGCQPARSYARHGPKIGRFFYSWRKAIRDSVHRRRQANSHSPGQPDRSHP